MIRRVSADLAIRIARGLYDLSKYFTRLAIRLDPSLSPPFTGGA